MTLIARHIAAFLQQRLPVERQASPNTCDSYADAFRLLFAYASNCLKIAPSQLQLEHIDASLITNFLNHLEAARKNSAASRNIRLAAIKSFMRYVEYRVPSALEQIHCILSIPTKKTDTRLVRHLTAQEMQAILDAPDPATLMGIRDRAMLHLCFAGGLRVSELVGIRVVDVKLLPEPSVLIHGKGRRERCVPLWRETASAVRAWLSVRGEVLAPELFINARKGCMTRAGFEYILRKHVRIAEKRCLSLASKRVSPHVLRHTCAMTILQATKDLRKVSLWLGHSSIQTTEIYTRADPTVKLETLEAAISPKLRTGRFKATDKLIALLKAPTIMRSVGAVP
ncbi:MAG: tyrosine-type recombinase/integrase [Candidatus Sulfotelmatobacter sp.]